MIAVLKREWIGFFKNPIAYVILAVYAFLSALLFYLRIILPDTSYMGNHFGGSLFLVEIIIVSVMSMRFFTEEKKNKTDQLMFTSPVGIGGIVLGKFFGGMTLYTVCTLLNLIYVFIIDVFGTPDKGTIFTNFVGTLLLGAAMIAVALFVSSRTESSIGAAAGTAGVFILFMMINLICTFLTGVVPTVLLTFIRKLNVFFWFEDFTAGILSLKAVVFYLSITAAFLFLAARVLERRRWR